MFEVNLLFEINKRNTRIYENKKEVYRSYKPVGFLVKKSIIKFNIKITFC